MLLLYCTLACIDRFDGPMTQQTLGDSATVSTKDQVLAGVHVLPLYGTKCVRDKSRTM